MRRSLSPLPSRIPILNEQVAVAYWGKVQMMFVGAFIVDVGIEHVNLHQRLALKVLLGTGAWCLEGGQKECKERVGGGALIVGIEHVNLHQRLALKSSAWNG
jgi:hypothetical protein